MPARVHNFAKPVLVGNRGIPQLLAIGLDHHSLVAGHKINRRLHDLFEHRRHIVRGLADDAQNVRTGGLPGQRHLGFVEQPRVLNGDHGLISKGLRQRNLITRIGLSLAARKDKQTKELALAQKRHVKRRIYAINLVDSALMSGQVNFGPVRQMQDLLTADRARRKVLGRVDRDVLRAQILQRAGLLCASRW